MKATLNTLCTRLWEAACLVVAAAALAGCWGGSAGRPKPAELGANPALMNVRAAWNNRVGAVNFPLEANVNGSTLTLAA